MCNNAKYANFFKSKKIFKNRRFTCFCYRLFQNTNRFLENDPRFETDVVDIENFIRFYTKNRLNTEGGYLTRTEEFLTFKAESTLKSQGYLLDHFQTKLEKDVKNVVKYEKIKLDNLLKIIDLVSIETTLKRGFSISKIKGKVITKMSETFENAELETYLSDGIIHSKIIK